MSIFFLPKTLAVPHARPAPPLVGSEKALDAARADQRRICAAQRVPRIRVCEGRLVARSSQVRKCPARAIEPGIFYWEIRPGCQD